MNVDEVLKRFGLRGRWQFCLYSVLCLGFLFPGAWHIVSIVWIGYKPPHHCKVNNNSALEEWIPRDKNNKLSSCLMFSNSSANNNNNQTTFCVDGWQFDEEFSGPTIVTKWNMVCDRDYLVDTSQTVMTIGVLIGSITFTQLSDHFGRKPILVLSQLSMSLAGALTVLPDQLQFYYILRFFEGMFQQGVILCNLVMLVEMFSSQDRALIAIGGSALWGLANALLPLVAWAAKNWVVFELVISLYGFLFIPLFCWLPESVPWLYANRRLEQAEHTLLRAAKMNNITLTQPILSPYDDDDDDDDGDKGKLNLQDVKKQKEKSLRLSLRKLFFKKGSVKKISSANPNGFMNKDGSVNKDSSVTAFSVGYSILDLFKNRMLLRHTIICLLFGLVDNLVYFGLILSSNSLSGNHYVNGFLNAIIEVPACMITYFAVNRFGRKRPVAATHVLAGLSLLACIVASHTIVNSQMKMIVISVLNNIGKFGITGAFAIIFFYVAELFPTNLRNQGVGICVFFARLGSIMASYASFVMERYPDLLTGVFGMLSILVAVLVLFLPETHNRPLADSISEMEAWNHKPIKDEQKDDGTLKETINA